MSLLRELIESIEDDFESVFSKVIKKLEIKNVSPVFDSSSVEYGLKQFLKFDQYIVSLLPDEDEDFIGIIGKNGDQIYYVDKSGKGKIINSLVAEKLIKKLVV